MSFSKLSIENMWFLVELFIRFTAFFLHFCLLTKARISLQDILGGYIIFGWQMRKSLAPKSIPHQYNFRISIFWQVITNELSRRQDRAENDQHGFWTTPVFNSSHTLHLSTPLIWNNGQGIMLPTQIKELNLQMTLLYCKKS